MYSESHCGGQSRLEDSLCMHDVIMLFQGSTADIELEH